MKKIKFEEYFEDHKCDGCNSHSKCSDCNKENDIDFVRGCFDDWLYSDNNLTDKDYSSMGNLMDKRPSDKSYKKWKDTEKNYDVFTNFYKWIDSNGVILVEEDYFAMGNLK